MTQSTPAATPAATWIDLLRCERDGGGRALPGHRPLTVVAPDELPAFRRCVAVTATVAPVVLTSITGRPSGLVSWRGDGISCTLGWDGRGRPTGELTAGGTTKLLRGETPLIAGRWSDLTLLVTGEHAELSCDGIAVDQGAWAGRLTQPGSPGVVVGSRVDSGVVDSMFDSEATTGLVSAVKLGTADDPAQLVDGHAAGAASRDDIDPLCWLTAQVRPDHDRPRYHFIPPAHWMNEPHAPIEVGGIHHLFYQSNRRGPFWGGIEWGHAVSRDLVHWRHLPPAVTPGKATVAPTGVWSGSSVVDDVGDVLLYVTAGDAGRDPDQSVAIARPDGGGAWSLDPQPVVEMPDAHPLDPALRLVPGQFRDPFVWRDGAAWFMVVGAGVVDRGGVALLYSSPDGQRWTSERPLLVGDRSIPADSGEMWELPVLLPVKGVDGERRHVLFVSSWWHRPPPGERPNVWYWIGSWDPAGRRFAPDRREPRLLDVGEHFTGPSGYVTSDGRTVVWSIAQDGRPTARKRDTGWAHNAGLPIEIALAPDGELTVAPVRELASLRAEALLSLDAPLASDTVRRFDVAGLQLEIDIAARCGLGDFVELGLRADESGGAGGILRIESGQLTLRRPGAAAYDQWCPDEEHVLPVEAAGAIGVRVFIDGSMTEIYVDGRRSLTSRIHATAESERVTLRVGGSAVIDRLAVWRLDAESGAGLDVAGLDVAGLDAADPGERR